MCTTPDFEIPCGRYAGPRLERGEIRDVDDDAARRAEMRRRGLREEKGRAKVERHDARPTARP